MKHSRFIAFLHAFTNLFPPEKLLNAALLACSRFLKVLALIITTREIFIFTWRFRAICHFLTTLTSFLIVLEISHLQFLYH